LSVRHTLQRVASNLSVVNSWGQSHFFPRRKRNGALDEKSQHGADGRQKSKTEPKAPVGAAKLVKALGETVTTVVISRDKKLFAAGAINKRAVVCAVADGSVVAEFTTNGEITSSLFAMEGDLTHLILSTFTGMVFVYHISSNSEQHAQKVGNGEMLTCMAIDQSYSRLAVGGKSASVLLYALSLTRDVVGMTVLHTFHCDTSGVLSLSLDSSFTKLVAGDESKVIHIWQMADKPSPSPHPDANPHANPGCQHLGDAK
jgi:WD40 repeat protein